MKAAVKAAVKAEVKDEADEGNKSASSEGLCMGVQTLQQQLEASPNFECVTRQQAMNMGENEADEFWERAAASNDKFAEDRGTEEAAIKAAKADVAVSNDRLCTEGGREEAAIEAAKAAKAIAEQIEWIRQRQGEMAIAVLRSAGIEEEAEEDAGAAAPAIPPADAAAGAAAPAEEDAGAEEEAVEVEGYTCDYF